MQNCELPWREVKKIHDKRDTIKDRDNKRQLDRVKKSFSNR